MDGLTLSVLIAACGIAVLHTAVGPDHYLPFVALSRARGWSRRRTFSVTALCGLGHVLSSVALGGIGVAIGVGVGALESVESARGGLAAWLLVAFGAAYALWGARRSHAHAHGRGGADGGRATFWAIFAVFVLGPCEPLIPLVVLPASEGRWGLAGATALVFGAVTVLTMTALVSLAASGTRNLRLGFLERWSHSLAGLLMAASGLAVLFAGI